MYHVKRCCKSSLKRKNGSRIRRNLTCTWRKANLTVNVDEWSCSHSSSRMSINISKYSAVGSHTRGLLSCGALEESRIWFSFIRQLDRRWRACRTQREDTLRKDDRAWRKSYSFCRQSCGLVGRLLTHIRRRMDQFCANDGVLDSISSVLSLMDEESNISEAFHNVIWHQ